MKLDVLVICAHPDDAELTCAGTIMASIAQGKKVGMVDLTRGEMGTRGTPELRAQEAELAAQILGVSVRDNLGLPDVFFENNQQNQLEVVKVIRKYRPEVVLTNAKHDRHPDHSRAANLVFEACFKSGLVKLETKLDGKLQSVWRPGVLYHCIQSDYIQPDFIVDVSDYHPRKVQAITAFSSQFYNPESKEPETFISNPAFLEMLEARSKEFGHSIGVKYGEGFTINRRIGVRSLFDLL
jgi:N-acetylglucosamine malate deacetylase 1